MAVIASSEATLDNLVAQFARPMDCLRELVQNAMDAGTPRVDVWLAHTDGVLELHVDDAGSGMDETIIDQQLTKLFSSTKEGDRTKIGKFGIGFSSIFAIQPDAVLLRTGRHGQNWELVFHPDRSYDKASIDEPVQGTQITLFKRMAVADVPAIVTEAREVLAYWCEHAHTPITFADHTEVVEAAELVFSDPFAAFEGASGPELESISGPLALDAAVQVTVAQDGIEALVGIGEDGPGPYGFYNGGLTLVSSDSPEVLGDAGEGLAHLSFKVRCDQLEHTLTRDNVLHDETFHRVLGAIHGARMRLVHAAVDALHAGAGDRDRLMDFLMAECRVRGGPPVDPGSVAIVDHEGTSWTLAEAEMQARRFHAILIDGPVDPQLDAALQGEGIRRLPDRPWVRRFAGTWAHRSLWRAAGVAVRRPRQRFVQPDVRAPSRGRREGHGGGRGEDAPQRHGGQDGAPTRCLRRRASGPRAGGGRTARGQAVLASGPGLGTPGAAPRVASAAGQHHTPLLPIPAVGGRAGSGARGPRAAPRRVGGGGLRVELGEADPRRPGGGAPMSLDAVLARSRWRAKMTERRRFTVASDKAFEKQKMFAMQNPADWVLRAFQAAVFSHAELVGMDTRPTQVTIGWMGGTGVLPDELDDLFKYLLTDRSDASTRHLSQLALAVVGALAMDPVEVRIESVGVGLPVCMVIDAKGEARVGEPSVGIDGTYMTVVKRHALFRRFHGVSGAAEVDRLWPLSQYSPVPLMINPCTVHEYTRFAYVDGRGELIGRKGARRWTLWDNVRTREHRDDTLAVVVGGITIEHVRVPGLGVAGVVSDDDLRLSADQSRVARGPRWAALLHFLLPRVERHLKIEGLAAPQVHLPELREEGEDEIVVVEAPTSPVPDLLPTVPPRPPLPCPRGPGPPLLYVLPEDVEGMAHDLDPFELPIQVAVLTEAQGETVRRGGRPAHRLTAGAGLAFVRRMAVADEVLAEGTVEEGGLTLTMRLHPGDGAPPWGGAQAPLPLVVRRGARTVRCGGAGLYLPGCSAVVGGTDDIDAALELVQRRGLEAAQELAAHDSDEARALLLHLVGHLGIPHLVEREGAVVLDLVLPPALTHARGVPLLGDLDLAGVLAMAGTERTAVVDDVDRFAPVEAWLGAGHLTDGSVEEGVLAAVGYDGESWVPVERLGQGGVCQVLAVLPTFLPLDVPEGWARHEVPLPLFALHETVRSSWADGAVALLERVDRLAATDERLTALRALASVHLARMSGVSGDDLHPSAGWRVEAVAIGGLGSMADDVLPVSLDLYRALQPDVTLPLHLDDEGDVWGAPDRHDGVLRLPVETGAVDGWVGLRRPFDPTGGVFLHRRSGRVDLLSSYAERFPSHGVLRCSSRVALDGYGLLLPGLQLYRSLALWLRSHPDDLDARAYAHHLVHSDVASPLVAELAPYVALQGSDLSLADWLALSPPLRPDLNEADAPFAFVPSAVGAARWVERMQAALDVACTERVALRGLRGVGRFGADARFLGRGEDGVVRIDLWLRGADFVLEEPRAVEVLLVDALRSAANTLQLLGYAVDLAAGVEVLAAGR